MWLPRNTIVANLEVLLGYPLIAPEAIHEEDLRALWALIEELHEEIQYSGENGPFVPEAEQEDA